jgi:hypothetical protein
MEKLEDSFIGWGDLRLKRGRSVLWIFGQNVRGGLITKAHLLRANERIQEKTGN